MNEKSINNKNFFKQQEEELGNNIFKRNNKMFVSGTIKGDVLYSHTYNDIRYYEGTLQVRRISGTCDYVPFLIPENVLTTVDFAFPTGKFVKLAGTCRSYNKYEKGLRHLQIKMLVRHIEVCNEIEDCINMLYLEGTLCKDVILRKTPSGTRISELFLAVNNGGWTSYYFPCIAWNDNAESIANMKVGEKVRICGNFQSRTYQKVHADKNYVEEKVTHEVSVFFFNRLKFD